jgi:hypothetical protein
MGRFAVRRVQHPVGQGGFHTAEILIGDERFRYVYDCGSKKAGAIEGPLARMTIGQDALKYDWLVISSFDADHFNGIDKFKEYGITFKKVFLPHLLQQDFLEWLLCSYLIEKRSDAEITHAFRLLKAISRGEFGTVGVTEGADPDGPVRLVRNKSTSAGGKNIGEVDVVYEVKDEDWMFRLYSREHRFAGLVDTLFNNPLLKPLKYLIERAAATVTDKTIDDAEISNILSELFRVLTTPPPAAQDGNAQAVPDGDVALTSSTKTKGKANKLARVAAGNAGTGVSSKLPTVKQILSDAYDSLKENGKRVFSDYNALSLCMYSGPRTEFHKNQSTFESTCLIDGEELAAASSGGPTRRVGWLGFGDIGFGDPDAFLALTNRFSSEFGLARTKMVPHHGAQSNYGKELFALEPFFGLGPPNTLWIAAANPLSGYRHPDGVVVLECQKRGIFKLVSEDAPTRIEETIGAPFVVALLGLY